MCPAGVESIVGALYFISSLPSQAIISSHLTQTLWSGYILTCKDGRLVGARDLIMSAVAWGGMLAGIELRSGHPGACWADGIERGGKNHQLLLLSQLHCLQQTLYSHLLTVNICSAPSEESRKAKRTFSSWRG